MKFSSTLATATLAAFATSAQANDIESYPTTNQAKCMLMAAQAGVESFAEVQAFRDSSNGTDTDIVKAHVIENMDGLTVSMRHGEIKIDAFYQDQRAVILSDAFVMSDVENPTYINIANEEKELQNALGKRAEITFLQYKTCMSAPVFAQN